MIERLFRRHPAMCFVLATYFALEAMQAATSVIGIWALLLLIPTSVALGFLAGQFDCNYREITKEEP